MSQLWLWPRLWEETGWMSVTLCRTRKAQGCGHCRAGLSCGDPCLREDVRKGSFMGVWFGFMA